MFPVSFLTVFASDVVISKAKRFVEMDGDRMNAVEHFWTLSCRLCHGCLSSMLQASYERAHEHHCTLARVSVVLV